jgi:N-acetylmuramoyl-L-alanine amidase
VAQCPFAIHKPISGPSGGYKSGPVRIVHHTTEGASASTAMAAYAAKRADPHFTVDRTNIYQHIDTGTGARALRNGPGGIETNRLSAVQIEVVGFAGKPKSKATLANVARLCRWIEATHGVPRVWPAGLPKPATAMGKDPGGHNRSASTWLANGGHYGHSQVPENVHWDPGYSKMEVNFLMNATFDADGMLDNAFHPLVAPLLNSISNLGFMGFAADVMEDHFEVGAMSVAASGR